MSFFSDLFKGNFGNLGNDLFGSPTAILETLGGLGAVAAPFALPALAGLAVPAAGEAAASFSAGEGVSGLGDVLASLGLTGSQVDPTLLGAASASAPQLATGVGGAAGEATAGSALGFAGAPATEGAAGINPLGLTSSFNPPGVGYFPDFSAATLGSSLPGGDPGVASLAGLTSADLPQIPGDALALGGYAGTASPLGGTALSGLTSADLPAIPSEALASYGLTPGTAAVPGAAPAVDLATGAAAPGAGVWGTTPGAVPGAAAAPATAAPGATAAPESFLSKWGPTLAGLGLTGGLAVGGQLLGPKLASALGTNTPPGSANLTQTAQQAQQLEQQQLGYGQSLQQPLATGVLPPGAQAMVDQATQAAIATIRSKFASLGMGSSEQEAAAIAQVQQSAAAQAFQLALQMQQAGQTAISGAENALNLQGTIYSNLMNATIQQDTNLSNAISNFASAVGGGLAVGTGQQLAKNALSK